MAALAPLTLLQPGALVLLVPVLAALALLYWRRREEWRRPLVPALRAVLAVLVVLALAQPVHGRLATRAQLIVLVDQSASLGTAGREELLRRAEAIVARAPEARLIAFAGRPAVIGSAGDVPDAEALDANASNLAAALDLAAALRESHAAPGSAGDRVVLLSDGLATTGDTAAAVELLATRGITVDVWPYVAPPALDVALLALDAPRALRVNEPYPVTAYVYATAATTASLTLWQDGEAIGHETVDLVPGNNAFSLDAIATGEGIREYQAQIQAPGDAEPLNDALGAASWVYPAPSLLVAAPRGEGQTLQAALTASGMNAQFTVPGGLPTRLSELTAYDGLVLVNVPASALSIDQMLAIEQYTRELGHGLLVVGGRQSYTLGGYGGTPLAAALPLEMTPPEHTERPPVALLLIIDHSASMGQDLPGSKLSLAKEAALRAAESLRADDYLGVLAFDDRYEWTVPFRQVGDGAELLQSLDRIAAIAQGGSTRLYQALAAAVPDLLQQPVATRHVVVMTDGLTQDGSPGEFEAVAQAARSTGATISVIAVGRDADAGLSEQIAGWGGGRYHLAERPEDLPELTLQETKITQSEAVQSGEFQPVAPAPHPLLRGQNPADFPPLSGYVALAERPGAEIALAAGPGDPLLAVWQYGLGRVVAWTADDGGEWAARWRDWSGANAFWAQLARYALPDPDLMGPLAVQATDEGHGIVRLSVEAADESGRPVNLADASARVSTREGEEWQVPLTQVSPGRYQQDLSVPGQGVYFVEVALRSGDFSAQGRGGAVIAYPAEFRPAGAGAAALAQVAELGGGRVIDAADEVVPPRDDTPDAEPVALWPWLLGAAVLLLPVYIVLRRGAGGRTVQG